MGDSVINVSDLTKTYHLGETELQALRGVSFEMQRGDFIAIMGASGSGKSTLMNILGCLDHPTTGRYVLEDVDVSTMNADRRAEVRNDKIGFIFQNFNLLSRTTALENVELPLIYSSKHHMSDAEMRKRAGECLQRVGLQGREKHTSSQLSGGQQQRVAIARALVNDPAILLADEPTGNLDSRTSEEIMKVFQELNREGKSILLITHEHDIAAFARRVITLRDGLIISDTEARQQ